jgi:hypothetical protein
MDTNQDEVTMPENTEVVEVSDTPPAGKKEKVTEVAPVVAVDNSAAETVVDETDVPLQELPDSDLPREIAPGAMGAERARLMQLIGLDVNHPFDGEAIDQITRRVPDYDGGTVTKAVWRELYKENPVPAA